MVEGVKLMEGELGIKIRTFKLNCVLREFGNEDGNRVEFDKEFTPTSLNLYLDRNLYLTLDAGERFQNIMQKHIRSVVSNNLISIIEDEIRHFIRACFSTCEASFEPLHGQNFVIHKEPEFEYY